MCARTPSSSCALQLCRFTCTTCRASLVEVPSGASITDSGCFVSREEAACNSRRQAAPGMRSSQRLQRSSGRAGASTVAAPGQELTAQSLAVGLWSWPVRLLLSKYKDRPRRPPSAARRLPPPPQLPPPLGSPSLHCRGRTTVARPSIGSCAASLLLRAALAFPQAHLPHPQQPAWHAPAMLLPSAPCNVSSPTNSLDTQRTQCSLLALGSLPACTHGSDEREVAVLTQ